MSLFHWQALTAAGEPRQGALTGESEVQVIDALRRQGLRVTTVRRELGVTELTPARAMSTAAVAVLRELLALRRVGLGVPTALGRLAELREASGLDIELALVRRAIEAGQALGEALARVPQRFDDLSCAVLVAGERRGELDVALARLVDHLERSHRRDPLAAGLRRISWTVVGAVLVTAIVLGLVAPAALNLYAHLGVAAPRPLAGAVALLPGLRWFAAVAALLGLGLAAALRTPRLRARLDALALRLPGLGPALRAQGALRLARLLALLVDLPLLTALELSAPRLGNHALGLALLRARTLVAQGVELPAALADAQLLPALALELLRVAEGGERAAVLTVLVDICEAAADEHARRIRQLARTLQVVSAVAIVLGLGLLLAPFQP
ncbi:type II secretion system F family protein [Nannocystis sp.]|uniref:type II secretion system F family protein n=1 Tax=Nannocystis sp. TaxID=1962667 RepID=UPI0025F9A0F0|nr:type II secretion system F family protein [Nannocystis sp.]